MKVIGKATPLTILGAGLVVALLIVALGVSGLLTAHAQDPDGVIVGIDMDTTGNSCPQAVAGVGADCTLGAIDQCVSVSVGASVTFDVFLDDLDLDSHLGHGYYLDGWPASGTDGTPPQITAAIHQGAPVLITSRAGFSIIDFNETVPDGDLPYDNSASGDLGTAEYNPPYTQGVLDRFTLDTTGAAPGVYGLTLSTVTVGRDTAADAAYPGYPLGGNVEPVAIWDYNFTPKYGILAVGVPCPQPTDVFFVSQDVRAANCTDAAPATMPFNTPTEVCVHKVVRQNDVVSVVADITPSAVAPGGCTATANPANPTTAVLPQNTDVAVDERYTLNCSQPSTHVFTFNNAIQPQGTSDPDPSDNTASDQLSLAVTATADLAVTSVTVTSPATAGIDSQFLVTSVANVTNNGLYSPVTGQVTSILDLSGAAGCTTGDPLSQAVDVPGLGSGGAGGNWTVTCSSVGTKTFDVDATIVLIPTTHVSDPNAGNDINSGSDQTEIVLATADVKVQSYALVEDEMPAAGTQLRVVPGVAENMNDTEVIHNNGPDGPVDVGDDRNVPDVAGCDVQPNIDIDPFSLQVSVAQQSSSQWSVTMDPSVTDFCTLTFSKILTALGANDPTPGNNTASFTVDVVRDADDDTVPDNYGGVVDNCPAVANLDQADQDLDGIGDACDPDIDGDTVANDVDNCPLVVNPLQEDLDADGLGDACDPDIDGDGVSNTDEEFYGSDPLDAASTPEHAGWDQATSDDSCSDGVDDDLDDSFDSSELNPDTPETDGPDPDSIADCEPEEIGVTPTPTATPAPTETATVTPTATATATATGTPTPVGEVCSPVIPGTYNGLVRLNGVPAADGFALTATIGGTAWGDAIVSGGRYAIDIPEKLPVSAPCFEAGTITFKLDGGVCEPTAQWGSGLHELDLNCAPAPPSPTPGTPPPGTPVRTPSVTPVTTGTPAATPVAPPRTGGGGLSPLSDLPWVPALAAGAVLTWVLAAAGVFHSIRRRTR